MKKSVFITGNSSGLGLGLSKEYLERGWRVLGLSRRGVRNLSGDVKDVRCDLAQLDSIGEALSELFEDTRKLDLVFLNAGILGRIREIHKTPVRDIQLVMDVNVWANKIIMDWFIENGISIDQIVLISSGASVNGNKGWSAYALSKATLNMLAKLYSHEFGETHLTALAPGLVHTAMQDYLCTEVDTALFPSIKKLKYAMDTPRMPSPEEAAKVIADAVPRLKGYPSGSFVDLRTM